MKKIQTYVNRASIQKFIGMEYIDIYFYKVVPLNGSSYFEPLFKRNNNIVNIQNYDENDCFIWSINDHRQICWSEITCHEKKYPIEIIEDDQSLVEGDEENQVQNICIKCHKDKNDINYCHNIKVI